MNISQKTARRAWKVNAPEWIIPNMTKLSFNPIVLAVKQLSPNLLAPLVLIMVSMVIGMTLFEYGKHLFFMNLTMWGSHTITTIFSAFIATIISYFVLNKIRGLNLKVKTLSGLLPICSHCKKIRDDEGYWNQIEKYINDHSEADFSHGICPECFKNYYPDYHKGY
jgi:hypothetical protein